MSIQLVLAQLMLMTLGLIAVGTAQPHLILDHGAKLLVGLGLTFVVARLRPTAFLKWATPMWLGSLVLLVLVLFIGVGTETSQGTKRWLDFGGPFRFQPSELAKLALVVQLASFFSRRGVERKLISATIMILVTTLLIVFEPDMGTSVLTFGLGIVLMFAAGVRISNIAWFGLGILLAGIPLLSIYLQRNPYILERWQGHQTRAEDMTAGLDQIGLAHRDLSNGGLWGLGPDGPRYEYFAAHTDMAVASVGFSTGLLGVAMIFFAYWMIVHTSLQVSQLAARVRPMTPEIHAASTMATGAMFMIVGQAMVNLAVAAGIFPVTGVPLPLISYGFSSILTKCLALGIIHSAMREVRAQLPASEDPATLMAVASD